MKNPVRLKFKRSSEIDSVLVRDVAKDLPIAGVAYANLAVFSALLFAASGLNSYYAMAYAFFVFIVAVIMAHMGRKAMENSSDKSAKFLVYAALILGEFALTTILIFDMIAPQRAGYYTALASVAAMSLVSVMLCAQFLRPFLFSKLAVIVMCCIFIISVPSTDDRGLEIIASLFIVLMIMVSIGSWLIWRSREQVKLRLQLASTLNEARIANDQLEEAKALRQRMISYVGHDLRQPLNAAAYTLLEMSKKSGVTNRNRLISDMEKSLKSAGRMIENIVQISHYDNPEIEIIPEHFSLQDLFVKIIREYQQAAEYAGCDIRCVTTSFKLDFDAELLTRIIRNLVRNVIKHAHADDMVLGVKRTTENIEIWVIDNGIGLGLTPPGPVQRRPYKPISDNAGLGLGLEISRQLAQACGAELQVFSISQKGTYCKIIIPKTHIIADKI